MNTMWLGIDTTSSTGGVALTESSTILVESVLPVKSFHSEKLLPAVSGVLKTAGISGADLAGIGISAGPGSYTGIRIGLATAMGLSSGWNVPLKGVSSLRILAAQMPEGEPVLACIRARRKEVFAALFRSPEPDSEELLPQGIYRSSDIAGAVTGPCSAVGSGRDELSGCELLKWGHRLLDAPRPSLVASCACELAEREGFDSSLEPLYLRDFNQRLD